MDGGISLDQKAFVAQLIEAGSAYSAGRLAQFTKARWLVSSSSVELLTIAGAIASFQTDVSEHLGAHMRTQPPQSPLPLECFILFPSRSVQPLLDAVAGASTSKMASVPDHANAMVGEVANVIGQGLVKTMADRFGSSIIFSVPYVLLGTKAEIMSKALNRIGSKRDTVVLSHVELSMGDQSSSCSMLLIFESSLLRRFHVPDRRPLT
jgi:hypothetical protein